MTEHSTAVMRLFNKLREAGASEPLAKVLVEAISERTTAAQLSELQAEINKALPSDIATRADFTDLKTKILESVPQDYATPNDLYRLGLKLVMWGVGLLTTVAIGLFTILRSG